MNSNTITVMLFVSAATIIMMTFDVANGQQCPPDITCSGGPNDKCFSCGSACPPTCDDPPRSGRMCIQVCRTNSCQCTGGTVRNSEGQCVSPSECP